MNSLKDIAAELSKEGATLLVTHVQPDGDAIGSLLGLGLAMQAAGFNVTMFSVDGVPARYSFLPGAEKIAVGSLPSLDFQRVVTLDCSDHLRIAPIWEEVREKIIINIDHHQTNHYFGTLNLVDEKAAATGEIIYELLGELKLPMDAQVAAALYVAVSTDTGSFKFENTTPRTHQIAAKLLEAGAKPGEISPKVFDVRSREATFILRSALQSLCFSDGGRIAWMTLTEDDMAKSGARDEDLEGVVNFAKNIENVEVGLLFRARPDGTVRVGFRSYSVDVSKVAAMFGGGGHARAAGCTLAADLKAAVQAVLEAVRGII